MPKALNTLQLSHSSQSVYKFSMRKMICSLLGASELHFFVSTSPTLEKRRSLGTDVADTPRSPRATSATDFTGDTEIKPFSNFIFQLDTLN